MSKRRAWFVIRKRFDVNLYVYDAVTVAVSRGQAKHHAVEAMKEANWSGVSYADVHAVRAPEFDTWAESEPSNAVFTESYVRNAYITSTSKPWEGTT